MFLGLCTAGGYAVSQVRPEFTALSHSGLIGMMTGFGFGGLMVAMAVLMAFNLDVDFTVWATQTLAPGWTNALQSIEQGAAVKAQLEALQGRSVASAATPAAANTNSAATASAASPGSTLAADTSGPSAPELVGISHWINSPPLTLAGLRGKVVLIDFWTYSCINCIRTLPYTIDWYNKYKDQGFVVIGVHSPEFSFEHDTPNVEDAVKRFNIPYPVAQDNDFATWQAYQNEYWPAEYLIDARGVIRYTSFGEGDYDKTEQTIQQLLKENGATVPDTLTQGPVVPYSYTETPETYLGTDRQERFASPESISADKAQQYTIPATVPADEFAVAGSWTFEPEYALVSAPGAKLQLHFNAKDVYLVMTSDKPVVVTVTLLTPKQKNQSDDVDAKGQLTVSASRLYHLVQLDAAQEGTVELQFTQPGVHVFAFTFGD